jgi:4-amino-4-deoxy-L-arabinose transferase-like glycosyltransferase
VSTREHPFDTYPTATRRFTRLGGRGDCDARRDHASLHAVFALDDPLAPPSPVAARRFWRIALGWWLLDALARGALAWLVPLLPDEMYYWEWTRRLEGGYYDHPPGIALLLSLGVQLAGDTALGVRLGPWLAGGVAHGALIALAAELGGPRAAARAGLLMFVLPLATLGLVLATPDAPMLAALALGALFLAKALGATPRTWSSLGWWTLTGAAAGAATVSKYSGVLFPVAVTVACLLHPALRRRLREPGPWVAALVAAGLFAPVIVWNWFYEWVSFRFQLSHGFTAARGSPLTRELELLGGQLGLASPILFVLFAMAVWVALEQGWQVRKRLAPNDPLARRFALGVVAALPLLLFAVSAWRRNVEPNWPAPIYPAALALLAATSARWAFGRWYRAGVALAAVLLLVVGVQAWRPVLPLAPRRDPIARAHGWPALASAVHTARRNPFLDGSVDVWVAANRYQDAAALAFHLPDQPTVFALNLSSRRNQYDLWETAHDRVRPGDGLVVAFDATPHGDSLAHVVGGWFREHTLADSVALRRPGTTRDDGIVTWRRVWVYRIAVDIPPLGMMTWTEAP